MKEKQKKISTLFSNFQTQRHKSEIDHAKRLEPMWKRWQ